MAFPDDRLPVRVELAFGADATGDPSGWEWTDVTGALLAQQVSIVRGRANESAQSQPTSTTCQLDNATGDFTPGNPLGTHYPYVRRGVPGRICVRAGEPYLALNGNPDTYASTPDTAALDITGDLDVRAEVSTDWQAPQERTILGKWSAVEGDWSYVLRLGAGVLRLSWSTGGTEATTWNAARLVPYLPRRAAVRATLDVDNGDSGWTVRFFWAPSLDGSWDPIGDPVTIAGVTSIYAGAAPFTIAPAYTNPVGGTRTPLLGEVHRVEVRSGIDGPIVAAPDFRAVEAGATSFVDSVGLRWTLAGDAEITDWQPRMVGQVDDWAPTWPWGDLSSDTSPGEARADVTIAGLLRRLSQGQKALDSTLRRRIPSGNPLAYWPMEEDRDATQVYSPIPGVGPLRVSGLDFAADDSLPGSRALPKLQASVSLSGRVPRGTAAGWHVEMVYFLPKLPTTLTTVLRVDLAGSRAAYVLARADATQVRVEVYDSGDTRIALFSFTNPTAVATFAGTWNRLAIFSAIDGADTYVHVSWRDVVADTWWYASTVLTTRPGAVVGVSGTWDSRLEGMSIGHLGVFDIGGSPPPPSAGVVIYAQADDGFQGERAGRRLIRLCREEGVPLTVEGDPDTTERMGPQQPATLLDLLQECATVDGGVLGEQRHQLGLHYRTRETLYNQTPALVLNAAHNELTNPFKPILDDQRIRNDVTVKREGGSSAHAMDAVSIAETGIYDEQVTVNASTDDQLEPLAHWRLHLGTWPGMRYPSVSVELASAAHLVQPWLPVDTGDRLHVTHLPPQHPTSTVDLLADGYTETLSPTRWTVRATCSPAGPWTTGVVAPDDPGEPSGAPDRVDTDGSALAADVTAAGTQLVVHTPDRPWITSTGPGDPHPDEFPFDVHIAGETMTVSACTPVEWDQFGREMSGGWGTTDSGHSWTAFGGVATDYSVTGSAGVITLTPEPSTTRFQQLLHDLADCEVLVRVTPSQVATGEAILPAVLLRAAGDYYRVRLRLETTGTVGIDVTHTTTVIGAIGSTPWMYSSGSPLWVRARVDGQRVQGRTWPDGTSEPAVWQVDREITASPIASGAVGLTCSTFTGNTNTAPSVAYQDFRITTPQRMTVTRAANGVHKPHPVGADVRLAHPMIVSL